MNFFLPLLFLACLECGGTMPSHSIPSPAVSSGPASAAAGTHAVPSPDRPGPAREESPGRRRVVEYDLHIRESMAAPAGKSVRVLTINDTIPGPVLHFTEGDWARIRVHNHLPRETTSTHWHGLLVPNVQDGVPEVTTPLIHPGTTHTFEFPIRQAGTYWYHSHTHLQEQAGLYGAIVIQPASGKKNGAHARSPLPAVQDGHILQFSDWTNENPHEVHRSLLRGTEWYALKKGMPQSLLGAWKAGALRDYFSREKVRMKAMDISDVGYDAFLVNGRQEISLTSSAPRTAGGRARTVKLRLINSAASTYFYVTSATGPLTLTAADGMPVEPVQVKRLLMAIGETYDVLVTVPPGGRYEVRATAQDGSGHASAWISHSPSPKTDDARRIPDGHPATDPPPPDLYRMDGMLEAALDDDGTGVHHDRPTTPYPLLRSPVSTALPAGKPVREIPLHLTGDMERYRWSFNHRTATQESVIPVRKGEILRLRLVNDTMMHHPIHLHGFFFRLVNRHGDRSPLKHTVDLPPMGRHVIEFEANENGDWMFHCHLLYHMMAGMSRVISVRDHHPDGMAEGISLPASSAPGHGAGSATAGHLSTGVSPAGPLSGHGSAHGGWGLPGFAPLHAGVRMARRYGVNPGEHGHEMVSLWGTASLQSHMSEGALTLRHGLHDLNVLWEAGWAGSAQETEYEIQPEIERWLGPNLRAFAGARLTNGHGADNQATAGIRYRLPGMFWSTLTAGSGGEFRFGLAKTLQLTGRLALLAEVEYDTATGWEWASGAEYLLTKSLSLTILHHSGYGFGGGAILRF